MVCVRKRQGNQSLPNNRIIKDYTTNKLKYYWKKKVERKS